MTRLRVATWNVLYRDRPDRLGLVADHLVAVGADVVLLQETDPEHANELAARLGLEVAAIDLDRERLFLGVAVLWSSELAARRVRSPASAPLSSMYADAAADLGGRSLRVGSVHLSATPDAWRLAIDEEYRAAAHDRDRVERISDVAIRESTAHRLAQIDELISYRDQSSAPLEILCGDFNCVPGGIEYKTLLAGGLQDAWTAGPRLGSSATILARNPLIQDGGSAAESAARALPGFSSDPDYTLDFQFHSPTLTPLRAWTFGEGRGEAWPSDHLGIAVDYALA